MATPTWNDAVSVVACQKVSAGGTVRGTLNVSGLFGGYLFLRAMRLSASAPSSGLIMLVRRLLKGTPFGGPAASDIVHPVLGMFQDNTTAANLTTINGAPGANTIVLTTNTGFAGNQLIGVTDSATTPTRIEFLRSSKIASSTITADRNFGNTNIANGDTVTWAAMVPPLVWVDGTPNTGDIEVIFDAGQEATINYAVECWAQTLSAIG